MTQDNEPMQTNAELFALMAKLHCSVPFTGHQLGALSWSLDAMCESHEAILAGSALSAPERERLVKLHATISEVKGIVDQTMAYLSIAATSQLAAQQDAKQNAPSTPNQQ